MPRYASALPEQVRAQVLRDPVEALAEMRKGIDLLIVDLTHPEFDGLRLWRAGAFGYGDPAAADPGRSSVRTIRPRPCGRSISAVNDIIYRPVDAGELNARVRTQLRRKRYVDRLRSQLDQSLEMAVTDPLTGCTIAATSIRACARRWPVPTMAVRRFRC